MTKRTKIIISVAVVIIAAAGTSAGYLYSKEEQKKEAAQTTAAAQEKAAKQIPTYLIMPNAIASSQTVVDRNGGAIATQDLSIPSMTMDQASGYYTGILTSKGYDILDTNKTSKGITIDALSKDLKNRVQIQLSSSGTSSSTGVTATIFNFTGEI
jgi:1-aminocyclopropane-1-carboxylate deaminase/D-cysteine desulfhydrase-like pyridoxal-dependent ACC family enzyme